LLDGVLACGLLRRCRQVVDHKADLRRDEEMQAGMRADPATIAFLAELKVLGELLFFVE